MKGFQTLGSHGPFVNAFLDLQMASNVILLDPLQVHFDGLYQPVALLSDVSPLQAVGQESLNDVLKNSLLVRDKDVISQYWVCAILTGFLPCSMCSFHPERILDADKCCNSPTYTLP